MKGEYKLWYDAHASEVNSWYDFTKLFHQRFNNDTIERDRQRLWHTRKQKLVDPCEQFVYEMVALGKQIVGDNEDHKILMHIRAALHPDISISIPDDCCHYVDSMLDRITVVHDALSRQSRVHNKPADIPPLKGLREDILKSNKDTNTHTQANNRSSNGRGRSTYRNSYANNDTNTYTQIDRNNASFSYNNDTNHSNSHSYNHDPSTDHNTPADSYTEDRYNYNDNYNDNYNHRRNASDGNTSSHKSSNNHNHNASSRNRVDLTNKKCYNCSRFGHIARNCPDSEGFVMSMLSSDGHDMHTSQQNLFTHTPYNNQSHSNQNSNFPLTQNSSQHFQNNRQQQFSTNNSQFFNHQPQPPPNNSNFQGNFGSF
jgi:hypothetical protein